MTPALWLRDPVFIVRIDDDLVVLDTEADRYSCLLGAADGIRIDEGGALWVQEEAAAELQAIGIAAPHPPSFPRRTPPGACRELPVALPPGRAAVFQVALQLFASTARFRGAALERLLSLSAGSTRNPGDADEARLAAIVSAWRAALPWIPGEGECLQRAFQLRQVLARHGVAADWIFGVRTWPFGAHCWLQVGDLVVGDTLDRVKAYTPIMAA